MKKILALALAFLIVATVFTGCAKNEPTPTPNTATPTEPVEAKEVSEETYYYISPLASLEYWQAHRAGLADACAELGVTPKYVGSDKLDVDAMVAIFETAINDPNCAGIITACHFPDAYEPLVKMAKEKGIPVCFQTIRPNDDSERLCFLGTDYVEFGRIMMRQAAEATGGKGGVIISNNLSAGTPSVASVMQGLREEVENWPDMKIVAEVDDTSDASVAATKVGAALLANPDATVVIGGQSVSAIGAVTAIKEAGLSDKIEVISIDRDTATLEYVQNGDIYATVAGKQYSEVYYAVKICYDYKHGPKDAYSADDAAAGLVLAPDTVNCGVLVINKDNVEKFMGFKFLDE